MSKRILLICSETFPGSFKVITNLRGVLKGFVEADMIMLEELYTFKPHIPYKRLSRRLRKIQTDLALLETDSIVDYGNNIYFTAWGPPYDILLRKLNNNSITPSLIMCSTPGQSELSRHELKDYHNIIQHLNKGKLKHWLLNRRLYKSIGKIIKQSVYFPHTIDLEQFRNATPIKLSGSNVDLFCTTRLGKNILNQILGFRLSNIKASLHINFSDKMLDPLISDIMPSVVRHKWINAEIYYNLVAGMDLSLQATFTESFCYAVAERMCLGVPVITSFDIYLIAEDAFLSKYLCVKALDTPSEIAALISKIMKNDKLRRDLAVRCRHVIERIAHKNNTEARDIIMGFLK